jgi:hypothetical protein
MLPRTQPDYSGMPMVHPMGKTMAISGQMDGCNVAIVVLGAMLCVFFASVKLAKLNKPAWTDHGGRRHPTVAMVPRSRRAPDATARDA